MVFVYIRFHKSLKILLLFTDKLISGGKKRERERLNYHAIVGGLYFPYIILCNLKRKLEINFHVYTRCSKVFHLRVANPI